MPPLERQMLQTYNVCQMIQADAAREAWEGGMQCSQCQHANRDTAKFCEACGARLIHQCFHCGHHVSPWAKFCEECGTPLMASTSASGSVQSRQRESESESRFHAVLPLVIGLLQRERRVSYRTLAYGFGLDAALLTEVCGELSFKQLAHDIEGKGLVWTGQHDSIEIPPAPPTATHAPPQLISTPDTQSNRKNELPRSKLRGILNGKERSKLRGIIPGEIESSQMRFTDVSTDGSVAASESARNTPEAERRQLTVMFCDLVGSTDLAGRLDPEDLREVVRAYQEAAAEVIQRYDGHIAQYLGDGLLVYFGFPVAHEDDAQRAVYAGVGIVEAMGELNMRQEADYDIELAVRIGIHTGPVVVGEMGGGGRHENLALGETPNIAARLEGLARPNTAVISPATAQLVQRSFVLEELGPCELKGVAEPMILYAVVGSREAERDDYAAMLTGGFDALVGRDEEIGLLLRRWEQSKEGQGQVVLISGDAGLGKSSLIEGLRAHVHQEGYTRIAFRCSPYTINSALHPVIAHVQRVLGWQREDSAETKLVKLEQRLAGYSLPLEESVPLLAALLSLSLPEDRYPVLTLTPYRQREQTQEMLVAWMLEEAERQPLLAVWEDLHWADPSTLEILGLVIEQTPTVSMLNVLAFRPEFQLPWPRRSHLTPITLNRLERTQVEALVTRLTGGKTLPVEVMEHIVVKTDGVPLYVEELTKMLLHSNMLREEANHFALTGPLPAVAIPDTLQASLMARLDQMNTAKEVAQHSAVIGREFPYDLIQAISSQDDETLQAGLAQLVEAELLYQRGRPPQARYIFKHALVQDAAYQSLLHRRRRQLHQQVAEALETTFPHTAETQPELVAHHFTEAACAEQAMAYWLRAGQSASAHSAYAEAIEHLTQGLQVLGTLPDTKAHRLQELDFQVALGTAFRLSKGFSSPLAGQAYARAHELCAQVGDAPQLGSLLNGLWAFYCTKAAFKKALEAGEQLLALGERQADAVVQHLAHCRISAVCFFRGEYVPVQAHVDQAIALYDPAYQDPAFELRYGTIYGPGSYQWSAWNLWVLGYPQQAWQHVQTAFELAQASNHRHGRISNLYYIAQLHEFCRQAPAAWEQANQTIAAANELGAAQWAAWATCIRGWALATQDQPEEGITQLHQGLEALESLEVEIMKPWFLAKLGEVYGIASRPDEGLRYIDQGLDLIETTEQCFGATELYRLRGHLSLLASAEHHPEAEADFHHAVDIARQQQAKSLELRAVMSLARLWHQQDKRQEAYDLLAPVYGWFTEGFDTADLIEAKQLLDELSIEIASPTA